MSKIHIGPHTHHSDPHPAPHLENPRHEGEGTYDREIDLRGIFWTGLALVVTVVVSCILMWGLLKGFNTLDDRRDLPPPLLPEARQQPLPPEPRLETSKEENLRLLRAEEDNVLGRSEWINRGQGSVRVPIDVAMEVVARRGWSAADAAGGTAAAAPPQAQQPGALVQMSRQPAQQGTAVPSAVQPGQEQTPQPQRPPAPPERR